MVFGLAGKISLWITTVGSAGIAGAYGIEKFVLRETSGGKKQRQNASGQGSETSHVTTSLSTIAR